MKRGERCEKQGKAEDLTFHSLFTQEAGQGSKTSEQFRFPQ